MLKNFHLYKSNKSDAYICCFIIQSTFYEQKTALICFSNGEISGYFEGLSLMARH